MCSIMIEFIIGKLARRANSRAARRRPLASASKCVCVFALCRAEIRFLAGEHPPRQSSLRGLRAIRIAGRIKSDQLV